MTIRPVTVRLWMNGMTMVFDQHGQQMPQYQGRWGYTLPRILALPGHVDYTVGVWNKWWHSVPRAQIEALAAMLTDPAGGEAARWHPDHDDEAPGRTPLVG